MIRALIIAAVMLPGLALADGWQVFGPDGSYQGRIEHGQEGGENLFGVDGSYQGRISRDGAIFGPDGAYQGRITQGEGEDTASRDSARRQRQPPP
jgi:hypothetical protein